MMIATRMSLTANGTVGCYMAPEHQMTGHHFCNLRNQVDVICMRSVSLSPDSNNKRHSLSVEDKSYAVNSFHLFANVLLAFWLFLVACSFFPLSNNANVFGGCRGKHAEKVCSSDRTISNASTENGATASNDTFSSECSHRNSSNNSWSELCTKCDAYYEISDFDKTGYMDSLLSLEGEDSELLSGSMACGLSYENPSTPLSYKSDAYYKISDFEQGSYLHSLLSLDDEASESEWLSDSKSFGCSSENPSTPLSHKYDAYSEISDFEKASYMHSLLSLEDEDPEWLSDSKPYRCSSENPSTPISYKCDASEISDLDKASYLHSLLNLEDEDSEWLSDSKPFGGSSENPSTPISCKFDAASEISDFDKESYLHSLISLEDEDSEWLPDSMSFGWSSENPSTPLSYKCDAFSDMSDLDRASYMHSLISLEDKEYDWLSESKSENSTPLSYKFDAYYEISDLDKASYLHSLLNLEDEDSEWLSGSSSWSIVEEEVSADEPLFWPFEGKLNWNSELSMRGKSSAKIVPLE